MSEAAPRHRTKVIAVSLVIVIIGAAVGTYLVYYLPQAGRTGRHGFAVESNRIVLIKLPGFNYSIGIWELRMRNSGNATAYVNYLIRTNDNIAYGNSSRLQPGQENTVNTCMSIPFLKTFTYQVSIIIMNSSGISSSDYPLTFSNSTQTQFSGQFSASSTLRAAVYNNEFQRNFSDWSLTVSNADAKSIQFIYAELWNGTSLLAFFPFLCAGGYVQQTAHAQPLDLGQTFNGSTQQRPVMVGGAFKVYVVVVYSDSSEVIQTYDIRAIP
ncbi:MAG TPA: hypothetical protein VGR53_11720 [Nitrososphaerales archaeon]|nr:hypothetical protein [Nitrososphaerales archaeon]